MDTRDDTLERDLRLYDFSQEHPIRNSLFSRLLVMHRMHNMPRFWQRNHLLADEELDYVAAAGNSDRTFFSDKFQAERP